MTEDTAAPRMPSARPARPREAARVAAIAAGLLAIYLLLASTSTLWDRDEPRFARAAVEMLRSGDFAVITFNGELRAVKPPLAYWLMAAGVELMGVTALAVRVFSALAMTAAAAGLYACARPMLGRHGAAWSMTIFGTALMPLWLGTAATADAVTVVWMVAAQFTFTHYVYRGPRWYHPPALALALGLTALGKGPLAALPVFSIALSAVLLRRAGSEPRRRFGPRFWIAFAAATAAGVAIFAAWAVPANAQTQGELAREGLFNKGFITRMIEPMQGHGGSGLPGYLAALPLYLPMLVLDTFPWCLLLPGAVSALIRRTLLGPRERAIIWGWTLPTFVIFTLAATKLPHYMLGLMPALSIALAATLRPYTAGGDPADGPAHNHDTEPPDHDRRWHPTPAARRVLAAADRAWVRGGAFFYAAIGYALAGGLLLGPWLARPPAGDGTGLRTVGTLGGLALAALTTRVLTLQLRERVAHAAATALAGHAAVLIAAAAFAFPLAERHLKISPELARAVRRHVPPDAAVAMRGYEEPSLVFYLDRPIGNPVRTLGEDLGSLREFAAGPAPRALVISQRAWDRYSEQGPMPDTLERVDAHRTLNYSARAEETQAWVMIKRP